MICMPNAAKEIDSHKISDVILDDMFTLDVNISEQQALNFSLSQILDSADSEMFDSANDVLRELIHHAIALINIQSQHLKKLKNDADEVYNKLMAFRHYSDDHREENEKK